MLKRNIKLASLISGSGTTMEAIVKECKFGSLRNLIKPMIVIASRDCRGIQKAKLLDIKAYLIDRKLFPQGEDGQEKFGRALLSVLKKASVDVITQNGWLPLTPKNVIEIYQKRIFNQHPAPLDPYFPDFGGKGMYGLRVHAAVINFQKLAKRAFPTEASVQRVGKDFDKGNLLLTQQIKVLKSDTPETLSKRVLPYEHQLQIKLLKLFVQDELKEYKRENRLIRKGEEEKLILAKRKAIAKYKYG